MTLAFSQACENNQGHILDILKPLLANTKTVLEIGSGTGQHAVYFSAAMPHLHWQPSDQKGYHADLSLRCQQAQLANLKSPIDFDVTQAWQFEKFEAIFTANSLHIMSWACVERFVAGAGACLKTGGQLCVYGPFNYQGQYTSPSNANFDLWLKGRDPLSAIRDFEKINALADTAGLVLTADHSMPTNNRLLVWQKT